MDGSADDYTNWSDDAVRDGKNECVVMSLDKASVDIWVDDSEELPDRRIFQPRENLLSLFSQCPLDVNELELELGGYEQLIGWNIIRYFSLISNNTELTVYWGRSFFIQLITNIDVAFKKIWSEYFYSNYSSSSSSRPLRKPQTVIMVQLIDLINRKVHQSKSRSVNHNLQYLKDGLSSTPRLHRNPSEEANGGSRAEDVRVEQIDSDKRSPCCISTRYNH